jgi:phosphate:Na+ symporter
MSAEQSDALFRLRAACRDIVEAIKDTKHLHKNMSKYIVSHNPHIRAEYNKMRVYLGSVLRQISIVQANQDDPLAVLSLDALKLGMQENDIITNGVLDEIIRKGRISPQMATSLMNDLAYVNGVTKNLLQMAEVLFAAGDQAMKDAERSIALDTDEIEEIMQSAEDSTATTGMTTLSPN